MEILIELDGKISKASVEKKAGWGFDKAALDAVLDSQFSPGMINGKPVRSKARITYRFELKN